MQITGNLRVAEALSSIDEDPYARSKAKQPLSEDAVVILGSGNQELGERVAAYLGGASNLADSNVIRFADGETYVKINKPILNGKDVYIV